MSVGFCQVCQCKTDLIWTCLRCGTGRCQECQTNVETVYNSSECLHSFCAGLTVWVEPSSKTKGIKDIMAIPYGEEPFTSRVISEVTLTSPHASIYSVFSSRSQDVQLKTGEDLHYLIPPKAATIFFTFTPKTIGEAMVQFMAAYALYTDLNECRDSKNIRMFIHPKQTIIHQLIENTASTFHDYLQRFGIKLEYYYSFPEDKALLVPDLHHHWQKIIMQQVRYAKF